jgi:lipopolysaccharide export system permease protein
MTLLQRHYIKEFLRLFGILSIGLSVVASLIELINRIDDFIPHRPSTVSLLQFCLLNIPNYFLYIMPVSILLSSLFVMGNAGRRRETVAIRSSGGSLKRLLRVFIVTAIIMTVLAFLIGEFISPPAMRKAHRLKNILSRKEEPATFKEGVMWFRSKEAIIKIDLYLQDKGLIKGLSIFRFDGDTFSERIEADYAEWKRDDGGWYLRDGTIYDLRTGDIRRFREFRSTLIEPPGVFSEEARRPEEMNLQELVNYSKRLKEAGFKNNKLLVDMQSRIAYPIINLIMMLLGISLAASGEMKSGLITAAIGIGISLLYWLSLSLALSMSYTGIIPAPIGPWSVPLVFGLFAIYRFSKIPE